MARERVVRVLGCLVMIGILAGVVPALVPEVSAALRPFQYMGTVTSKDAQSRTITIQADYEYGAVSEWAPCNETLLGTAPNDDSLNELAVGDYVEAYSLGSPGGVWCTLAKIKPGTERAIVAIYGDPDGVLLGTGEYSPSLLGGCRIEYESTPDCSTCSGGCNCGAAYTVVTIFDGAEEVESHTLYPGQSWGHRCNTYHIDITFHSGEAYAYPACDVEPGCAGPQAISDFTIHILDDDALNCCDLDVGGNLISLPVQPANADPRNLFDQEPLYLCGYNTVTGTFEWVDKPPFATQGTVGTLSGVSVLGGYWLSSDVAGQYCVNGTELTGDQVIDLSAVGWHMIGVPYDTAWGNATGAAVKLTRNGVDKWLADAVEAGWIYGTIFRWNASVRDWDRITVEESATLVPCLGYWIRTRVSDLTMTFTTAAWDPGDPPSFSAKSLKSEDPGNPPMPIRMTPLTFDASKLEFCICPNPVTGAHPMRFQITGEMAAFVEAIKVEIYDLYGKKVYSSGDITGTGVDWHTDNDYGEPLANGVYLCRMSAEVQDQWVVSVLKKIVLVR